MNFAALKAKAQEAADQAKQRANAVRAPSTTSQPVSRTSGIAPGPGSRERFQQSTALQVHQVTQNPPPPPPPVRLNSAYDTAGSQPAKQAPPAPARKPVALVPRASSLSTAPPAPPPRSNSSRSVPAPPYEHAANHDLPKPQLPLRSAQPVCYSSQGSREKRFSEYDSADKQSFFAMLDAYFESRLNARNAIARTSPPTTHARKLVAPELAPPPVAVSTRPGAAPIDSPSYPPSQTHSSSGLSICHWIMEAPYPSPPWYADANPSNTIPPPLQGRTDMRWTGSWSQYGSRKTLLGFALFGDASCAWWSIEWDASRPAGPGNEKRDAVYRPVPSPWDGERLYKASEMYGPSMVAFADQAVSNGRPIARGECWDVASEGLESVKLAGLPEPFPSIGRTHGHLMYYARSSGEGQGTGKWRGGDVYVRPGDVVEWRSVKIREVGMSRLSYCTLGDPEHTAIIVSAAEPSSLPQDGESFSISNLVSLTVVEQSQGSPPKQATYDLAAMSQGEIWIYRPVPLVEYAGTAVEASWPPKCQAWRVGDLP